MHIYRCILTLCAVAALLTLAPLRAGAERQHSDYFFKHVTLADGLSSSQVNAICKDSRGFMWFGTASGLNRYDGYNIRTYKSDFSNSMALPDGYVQSIQEDASGMLWIGTPSGYVVMDPVREIFDRSVQQRLSKVAGGTMPTLLFIDSKKNFWAYVQGKGLYFFKTQMQLTYEFLLGQERGLPSGRVTGICEMPDGAAVVFEDGTICGVDGEHQRVVWTDLTLARNKVPHENYRVFMDSKHRDIFVFSDMRTFIYDGDTKTWSRSLAEFAQTWGCSWDFDDAIITGVVEDKNHFVWLCTDRTGLVLLDVDSRVVRRHLLHSGDSRALPANNIQTLYIDDSNLLWVGTLRFGVSYWGFSIYRFILDRVADVNGISEDPQGNIWMATRDKGLICKNLEDTVYTRFGRQKGLSDDMFACVHVARDGSVWAGSNRYGLNHLQGNHVTVYRHDAGNTNSIGSDNVTAITEDQNGTVWVATLGGGMQGIDPHRGTMANFNYAGRRLPSDEVTSLATRGNRLVAGTSDGIAVVNLSTNQVEFFRGTRLGDRHFTNLYVTQVLIDSRGLIWVGTRDGLNLYNPKSDALQTFGAEEGLPNNMICGLAEDGSHHIWVTTAGGVCRLVPQDDGSNQGYNVYVYNYSVADGLQGPEYNQGSICTTRAGWIYMGGPNGFNWINIGETENRNTETRVLLTELIFADKIIGTRQKVAGQTVLHTDLNETQKLTLPYFMNNFAIAMSVSNYYRCDHPQFVYMLEGRDERWLPGDPILHGVRFTGLKPGRYVLHVKAINDDGRQSDDEHTLEIVLKRTAWLSWWAIAIYVLLLAGLAVMLKFAIPWIHELFMDNRRERELFMRRAEALKDLTQTLIDPISKVIAQLRRLNPMLTTPEQREISNNILHIEKNLLAELKEAKNEDLLHLLPEELRQTAVSDDADDGVLQLSEAIETDDAGDKAGSEPDDAGNATAAPRPATLKPKREKPKRLIYFVDSDETITEWVTDQLKNTYDFETFTTADAVMAALGQRRPDLIIANEMLADMRGSELCVRVKNEKGYARIPFVLMLENAMSASEFEKQGITVAADDYVLHFYDLKALSVRCARLMGDPVDDSVIPNEDAMLTADAMSAGVGELIRRQVQEFVRQNISNPKLALCDLCDAIGVPLPQLFRRIEKLTGKTPADYIREIRLAEAATLLRETDIAPIEVAEEVGMPNLDIFTRTFTDIYGESPTQYQERHRGINV